MGETCYTGIKPDKRALSVKDSAEREAEMKKYDYLIVGAGLYGAVMAYELGKKGRKCLVIDRGLALCPAFRFSPP